MAAAGTQSGFGVEIYSTSADLETEAAGLLWGYIANAPTPASVGDPPVFTEDKTGMRRRR